MRLRVLLTADAVGGVWTWALDLARELLDSRSVGAITLATLGPDPDAAQAAEARAIPGLRLLATGLPLDWLAPDAASVEAAGEALASLAAREGATLVHLHAAALAASARFPAPVVASLHSCVGTWWDAVRGPDVPLPPDLAWRAEMHARGLSRADALAAPSAAFVGATVRRYAPLSRTPAVVRNGRRAPLARLPPRRAPGDDGPAPVFAAGRFWDEGKGLPVLDRAAARVPGVTVHAAGPLDGPNGARAEPPRHLRALGRLPSVEVERRLAPGTVFASASLYEPFGLAVLEAAQAGCALVLSDVPAHRELWDGAADFAPPRDDEALAAALRRAATDAAHRARLADAARRRAERYTARAMADATLALYRTLPDRSAAAA